jgi:probable blue pigment (indigoidine) exporter
MNKITLTILLLITTGLMGSSFAIGKIGLSYFSPFLLVGLRFTIAGIVMSFVVILLKREHPRNMKDWFRILLIGFFQTAGVMGAIFLSMKTITAGESSILTFINP